MKKTQSVPVELRPGYHEWNLYIGDELIYTLDTDWDEGTAGMSADEKRLYAEATISGIIADLRFYGSGIKDCIEKHDKLKQNYNEAVQALVLAAVSHVGKEDD